LPERAVDGNIIAVVKNMGVYKVNLADIPGTDIVHNLNDKFQNASPRRRMQTLIDKTQAIEE